MRVLVVVAALVGVIAWPARPAGQQPQPAGGAGTWYWLQKLATTASLLHTPAHPDDEHGGMLALASRGLGARVALLTLTRGEAGDNLLGPQLFDALALIRTEELAVADRFYGVDEQYFTSVVDYGFSKRLEEAFDKWGRENVLRDMVRIIRTERPLVIVSRFQGSPRDGHGNHQTAGLLTRQAFEAAANPAMFPEQVAAGLRPWRARKLYVGGVRENEPWTVAVDTGGYSPWLGDSFDTVARTGLAFQRSQNGGRLVPTQGPVFGYYERVDAAATDAKEATFFDGIDTTVAGIFRALGRPEPDGAAALLAPVDAAVQEALSAFDARDPSLIVPALARGLAAARFAVEALPGEPDAALLMSRKIEQFQMAINTALGLELVALAEPERPAEPDGMATAFSPSPILGAVVPGQTFDVAVSLSTRGNAPIEQPSITLDTGPGWQTVLERISVADSASAPPPDWRRPVRTRFTVRLLPDAVISTRPYFSRQSLQDSRYDIADPSQFGKPFSDPPASAVARYRVNGVPVNMRATVRRREPRLPYGDVTPELRVVPALSVTVTPATAVVPLAAAARRVAVTVDLLNNRDAGSTGTVRLDVPRGWSVDPASASFALARAGERLAVPFTLAVPRIEDRPYEVRAVATSNGRDYAEGFEELDFRDLEPRHLYRPSTLNVRGLDVTIVPDLKVGYVMGIGDQVPQGIAQLGYEVTLLDEAALAASDLSRFDAIMTGTRAYAVRDDLRTYNQRLLDYARNGGHLIVLYNTQELVPDRFAPFPGELTARAEEVSEEDSPVDILAPDAPMLTFPNRITKADFDGWIEQRGSKFWSAWDKAYLPIIATYDTGQAPQRGGWLWARVGKGHYTYFAYAFHRQLPYGVPGAYRLLANLLALGKSGQ